MSQRTENVNEDMIINLQVLLLRERRWRLEDRGNWRRRSILTVGNMKRLPCSSFQNIDTVFWQLFYIACYSQLIY